MERVSKINYYLDIAQTVSERSTCLRKRFGAIIVKNDSIVSTGYNGAPRGRENCCDLRFCLREHLGIPRGERYEMCRSVHAEANAIIAAARENMIDALYGVHRSRRRKGDRRRLFLHDVQKNGDKRRNRKGYHTRKRKRIFRLRDKRMGRRRRQPFRKIRILIQRTFKNG